MSVTSPYPPISDYGAIGDCRTIALVSTTASIDWWCQPRFDAPSLFGRILDWEKGGACFIEAPGLRAADRRYLPQTAVLETRLDCEGGVLLVTDLLTLQGEQHGDFAVSPYALQKLVRIIHCEQGAVPVTLRCVPRPGYGSSAPVLRPAGPEGARWRTLSLRAKGDARPIRLGATLDWGPVDDHEARLEAELKAGDELGMVIDYGPGDHAGEALSDPNVGADESDHAFELKEMHRWRDSTVSFWQDWTAASSYDGPYRDSVIRSAITLKLLTYHPSGAIIAAGTTSLPEEIGGERNWDYRFTFLRDATFTLYALNTLGYRAESNAWMDWITHVCAQGSHDPLVLYRVDGGVPVRERHLDHLEGYRQSRPVRSGNKAAWQRQLDIYGEVLDAAYLDVRSHNKLRDEEWETVVHFAELAAERWRLPDVSIWEVRGPQRDFTYSKVLCWVALDRACRIAEMVGRADEDPERLERWRREADEIRRRVMDEGRRSDGAFAQFFGSDKVDASALVFPLVGFVAGDGPSALATLAAIEDELYRGDGLVVRYIPDEEVEGLTGKEGAFLICSYWFCDNLLLAGRTDEARERFESLSARANDLGLFSEEIDYDSGEFLGNFPQGFTHIALIGTAHNLARAERDELHRGRIRRDAPRD
jgi:GH15 family glucan-1,4-alpha-glucosidase